MNTLVENAISSPLPDDPQWFTNGLSGSVLDVYDIQFRWMDQMYNQGLLQRMILFWSNHFAVSYSNMNALPEKAGGSYASHMYNYWKLLHQNSFGDFRNFVLDMSTNSAMLYYLNNYNNRAGQPNEDFARELMELFTMGEKNEARPFSENLAAVKISDKWGFINSKETVEISPQFISAGNFEDGLAPVRKTSNRFGYVDRTGKMAIPEQFEIAHTFHEDRAAVFIDGKWTFIDKSGNQITTPKFDEVDPFFNGLAKVTIRIPNEMDDQFTEKFGYINKSVNYVWFPTN